MAEPEVPEVVRLSEVAVLRMEVNLAEKCLTEEYQKCGMMACLSRQPSAA